MVTLVISKLKKLVVILLEKLKDQFPTFLWILLVSWLFSFFMVSVLLNLKPVFTIAYQFIGTEIFTYLTLQLNYNYLDFTINFKYAALPAYIRAFLTQSASNPEILFSHFLFMWAWFKTHFMFCFLLFKFPAFLLYTLASILPVIFNYAIGLSAFNFFSISFYDFLINLSGFKEILIILFFNIKYFLALYVFGDYFHVYSFFSNSLLFHLLGLFVKFVSFLLKKIIFEWLYPFLIMVIVNFFGIMDAANEYIFSSLNFFKLCVLHLGLKLPSPLVWLFILKNKIHMFLYMHVPSSIGIFYLSFIYTPLVLIYRFFEYYWIEYGVMVVDHAIQTVQEPHRMYNRFMWGFTRDSFLDHPLRNFKRFNIDREHYIGYIPQLPFRRFLRQMWFVYPFAFVYTLVNSLGELIYEYCAEFQDHFFDIYEIYFDNYGLLYQTFDDYFFNYFLFYFFLSIGFVLEMPIYTLDYFLGKPSTEITTGQFIVYDWLTFYRGPMLVRWQYIYATPFQTPKLMLLCLYADVISVPKYPILFYYNTILQNEFNIFHSVVFVGDQSYLALFIAYVYAAIKFSVPYFLSTLNFILNSLQLNLFFFPVAIIAFIFATIKTVVYWMINFEPIKFASYLVYQMLLTANVLVYWSIDVFHHHWTVCFSGTMYFSWKILNGIICMLLFLVDSLKFLILELPITAVFEFYCTLHRVLLVEPITNLLLTFTRAIAIQNVNYFINLGSSGDLFTNFRIVGLFPLIYLNVYLIGLAFVLVYMYTVILKNFIQMIKYFRLGGILLEIQNLVNFIESPQARRLYYVMHFNELNIPQISTALAKERKPTKVVKAFYRKWFGTGHNHFIDYRWRIFTNKFGGKRRIKMRYLTNTKFRQPLMNDNFFYHTMDYIKHIRMLFLRINYSIVRFYGLNKFYYSAQFTYKRNFETMDTKPSGQMYLWEGYLSSPIFKYGFPIFSFFKTLAFDTEPRKFDVYRRFLGHKYVSVYAFPSYLFLSNLSWWTYFITIFNLRLLFIIGLGAVCLFVRMIRTFFSRKK